jgi:hypothetical protein
MKEILLPTVSRCREEAASQSKKSLYLDSSVPSNPVCCISPIGLAQGGARLRLVPLTRFDI